MTRNLKERAYQTLTYELGGLLLVLPLYSFFSGYGVSESLLLLVVISIVVMLWAGFHNAVFDRLEWQIVKRLASDRPFGCRVLHIISLELTTAIVSVPVILILTDFNFLEALVVDLLLTFAYTLYGFVFHYVYDTIRPVNTGEVSG